MPIMPELVVRSLGDRVKHWITLNEPWEHAMFGHFLGEQAPGIRSPWAYFKVAHHELLGHGLAVERIKGASPDAQVGITLSQFPVYPMVRFRQEPGRSPFCRPVRQPLLPGRPVPRRSTPRTCGNACGLSNPPSGPAIWQVISRPFDFLGVNYYSPLFAYQAWTIPFFQAWIDRATPGDPKYVESPELGPGAYPSGIHELAMRYRDEYGNPVVYITENGTKTDETVHDPLRLLYHRLYLEQLARAVRDGARVKGYFVWSLMDLNEWAHGYDYPMGMVYVDHATNRRTIKDSGYWYRDLIRSQGS